MPFRFAEGWKLGPRGLAMTSCRAIALGFYRRSWDCRRDWVALGREYLYGRSHWPYQRHTFTGIAVNCGETGRRSASSFPGRMEGIPYVTSVTAVFFGFSAFPDEPHARIRSRHLSFTASLHANRISFSPPMPMKG